MLAAVDWDGSGTDKSMGFEKLGVYFVRIAGAHCRRHEGRGRQDMPCLYLVPLYFGVSVAGT